MVGPYKDIIVEITGQIGVIKVRYDKGFGSGFAKME
jgi:Delta3-Delta2-enoyl-CoA isomerase